MSAQATIDDATLLYEFCSTIEKSFFSAIPFPSDKGGFRTLDHQQSLKDLVASAGTGCKLCKVFLHGYLCEQLRFNLKGRFLDICAVKDYLLVKESFVVPTIGKEGKSGLPFRFLVERRHELFLIPDAEQNRRAVSGPVIVETSPGDFAHSASVVIKLPYLTTDLTALRVSIDDPKLHRELLDQDHSNGEGWSDEHGGVEVLTLRLCDCEVKSGAGEAILSYGLVLMRNANDNTFRRVGLLDSGYQGTSGEPTAIDNWFVDAELQEVTII